jgi:hypothetical protein
MATTFPNETLQRDTESGGSGWIVAAYVATLLVALAAFIAVCVNAAMQPIPRAF